MASGKKATCVTSAAPRTPQGTEDYTSVNTCTKHPSNSLNIQKDTSNWQGVVPRGCVTTGDVNISV